MRKYGLVPQNLPVLNPVFEKFIYLIEDAGTILDLATRNGWQDIHFTDDGVSDGMSSICRDLDSKLSGSGAWGDGLR